MVSTTKDNTYGYGLPFGALITQAISPVANLDFGVLIGFMLVIMIMKMMMNMMSDMNKPVRQQQQVRMAPQKALIA
jgi:hypothetical protein